MRLLYSLLLCLALPLLLPALLLRPKTRGGLGQRLGLYPKAFFPGKQGLRIWLHGASAGDLLALEPVAEELRRLAPDCSLVFSTFTDSGMALEKRLSRLADRVIYQPLDLPFAARRAVRAIQPDLLVLEYAELWPNLIHAAKAAGAKVVLSNGRFSEDKLGRYRAMFRVLGNPLLAIDRLLMRSEGEAARARALGALPERVRATGNTKFDSLVRPGDGPPEELAAALRWEGPVLLAGSTHRGEEEILLEAFGRLRERHPRLRLVVAPRYLDRGREVAALAEAAGFRVAFRSQGAADAPVMILDTMGELSAAYALATLAFVGGSFTERGGQNILEPAARGRPVLFGPHMKNFQDCVPVLEGKGGIQVRDAGELVEHVDALLRAPEKLETLGRQAREAALGVRGAARRNAEIMMSLQMETSPTPSPRSFVERLHRNPEPLSQRLALAPLLPLEGIFASAAAARRSLYARGLLRSNEAPIPVLSVGNLAVGGAGKTPVVLHLADTLLERGWRVAILVQGYGGAGRGPRVVSRGLGEAPLLDAADAGDEALLLARRCPGAAVLAGKDRSALARMAAGELGAEIALLDDGFQHLALRRDLDLVVLDGASPFGNGHLLPRGPLREGPSALARAQLCWISKVDQGDPAAIEEAARLAGRLTGSEPVRSRYRPSGLLDADLRGGQPIADLQGAPVLLLAALARPASFRRTLEAAGARVVDEALFPDHQGLDPAQWRALLERRERSGARWIVCTEKDAVKIPAALQGEACIRVVQVESEIVGGREALDRFLDRLAPRRELRSA